jgi:hypothetical protein
MKKSMPKTAFVDAYLRLLNFASAVEQLPGMEAFDVYTKALFEEITLAWSKNTPLSVRKAIGIKKLGSPATLHKRVKLLCTMGLVVAVNTGGDPRTKSLFLTDNGVEYLRRLGAASSKALLSNA